MRGRHLAVSDRFVGKPLLALLDPAESEARSTGEITPVFGLVNRHGLAKDPLPVTVDGLRSLYAEMVEARCFDRVSTAMRRRGRPTMHGPLSGQEAAQIGVAASIRPGDWVAATHADPVLSWRSGIPWKMVFLSYSGVESVGRAPDGVNVLPPSDSSGGHATHAVGLALAEKVRGSDKIALASLGQGSVLTAHSHEAMGLAVAHETPAVFFYRSSGPVGRTEANPRRSHTISDMAEAFGMPAVRVDGRDVLAVLVTVQEACDRARRGNGPSLIEAVMDHEAPLRKAEDSARRNSEAEAPEVGDPLERVRRLLERAGVWTPEWLEELERNASQEIRESAAWAERHPHPTSENMIEMLYSAPTAQMLEQLGTNVDE